MVACYPGIIVSLTALVSLLLLPRSGYCLLIPGFLFCAAAVSLSYRGRPTCGHQAVRLIRSSLLFGGIGLVMGAWCSTVLLSRQAAAYTSLPLEQVTAFEGIALDDSRKISDGSSLHTVALSAVISRDARADARGSAVVFDESGSLFPLGEKLHIRGRLRWNAESHAEQFVSSTRSVASAGNPCGILRFRSMVRRRLDIHVERLGYPASSLFRALFLGIREDIPSGVARGFEETGTLHILALSGLHVGIISLLVFSLLRPVVSPWLKWTVVLFFLGFYLFLAGPRPSLIRAGLFLTMYGITRLLDRDWHPLNILGLTLLFCLLMDPGSAFRLSFQLSFLAVFGILAAGKAAAFLMDPYLPRFINIPLSYSFGAQIAVLPVSVAAFGVFYPAAVIATPLLLPLVTGFLWLGIISLPVAAINALPVQRTIGWIMDLFYRGIRYVLDFFSRIPGISGDFVLPGYIAFLSLILIVIIAFRTRGGWRWQTASKPRA